MDENLKNKFGTVKIADDAIMAVAGIAATDVKGVYSLEGGITRDNVHEVAASGVNVIVAGTAVFRAPEGIRAAVAELHDGLFHEAVNGQEVTRHPALRRHAHPRGRVAEKAETLRAVALHQAGVFEIG